ncbi:MAG: PA14 domain-containing protein [bacterium]
MKIKLFIVLVVSSLLIITGSGIAYSITVDVYSGHGTADGGAPYSDFVGSFVSPDIMFATNTGYAWHPFGLSDFGAEMTGCLLVSADALYTFALDSDDGSMLYINSTLVVDNGGPHSPRIIAGSAYLIAGLYPFKVEFYEDFGGPSGVDLLLPMGVSYAPCPVPEPSVIILLFSVLIGLVGIERKFRSQ